MSEAGDIAGLGRGILGENTAGKGKWACYWHFKVTALERSKQRKCNSKRGQETDQSQIVKGFAGHCQGLSFYSN